jgi:UDP-N-acetylmuramoylalanine--D-glutamate ligase
MTEDRSKEIWVLGAGESGVGAAVLAKKKGWNVIVSEKGKIEDRYKQVLLKNGIEFEEGGHSEARCLHAAEVIKSPGIPEKVDLIVKLRKAGIPVISEIEFAWRYAKAGMVCITGSNGKTTTTTWSHHILRAGGIDACLAGNVGKSFAMEVAEQQHEWYVLEISSFQLDGMFSFHPNVAVLTNVTPDHLDRYEGRFENYARSKFRIINNMNEHDHFIYCDDDPVIRNWLDETKLLPRPLPVSILHEPAGEGAWIRNKEIVIKLNKTEFIMSIESLALQGRHNLYNSMASAIVGKIFDIRNEVIKESLMDFQGVEHRLEFVAKVHDIEFINDSKATNVNSAWYALESMNRPVVWIAGGLDKGNDYADLKPLVQSKVKAMICLGVDNKKLHKEFGALVAQMVDTTSMDEAVQIAYNLGKPGDVVLLSPACASFDLFKNFEERGRLFKRAVFDL